MILSDRTIARLCEAKNLISPFSFRQVHALTGMSWGLSCAGYDVRIAEDLVLEPQAFKLASTVERFIMPDDLLGCVADKSTLARRGLAVQNTIFEPGWCGHLTLELTNHSSATIFLVAGQPIAQTIFHRLDGPVDRPYTGKYQNQPAQAVPAMFEVQPKENDSD